MSSLLKKIDTERIRAFFLGREYPLIIAALVIFGAVSGFEAPIMLIHSMLIFAVLLLCDSVKPLLISLCSFIYQISVVHAPQYPTYSNYIYTGWRLYMLIGAVVFIVSGLVIFTVKNKICSKISFKRTPLLLPTLIFALALLTNGLFSSSWKSSNIVFALANAVIYLVLYVFIYHGFSDRESSAELGSYFAYIAMLCAVIISAELLHLFLTSDNIIVDGSINKVGVALGWGIWNLVAVSLAMLIPLIFYGMMVNRYPWLYFTVASIAYVMSVLTMSRNALIFSTLTYCACVLICCFVGKHKRVFRIITLAGICSVVLIVIVLWNRIYGVFADYFERGFSDNGRFELWRGAFSAFLDAPVFGSGFYGLNIDYDRFGFLPKMAHQTVLQLLGTMGIFGILAYGYYRIRTAMAVFTRPNVMKCMLALSILTLLLESLLDNFIFNFYPVFYYVVALAIINRCTVEQQGEEKLTIW